MYDKYLLLGLCLVVLGGRLEAKTDQDAGDWPVSNTMSREDHEHHVAVRPSETIDIDERPPQGGFYSGDGMDMSDDDGSSGYGMDDEDDSEEGSAGMLERNDCLKIRNEMKTQGFKGHYIPKCTPEGEFETKQCDSSANKCWCVGSNGERIGPETEGLDQKLDCNNIYSSAVPLTKCLHEYEMMSQTLMPGAPSPPRCTLDGEYEKKQCHGSTGHCWCVDTEGLEIGGTRRGPGSMLDCNNVVPVFPDPITTPKPRKPAQKGFEEEDDDILTSEEDVKNSIDNMPVDPDATVEIKKAADLETNQVHPEQHQSNNDPETLRPHALLQPGLLAGIIGGAVVGLLCAVLLVMFIVYRMRKKDEGSYALDEPKRSPSLHTYARATNREFYA